MFLGHFHDVGNRANVVRSTCTTHPFMIHQKIIRQSFEIGICFMFVGKHRYGPVSQLGPHDFCVPIGPLYQADGKSLFSFAGPLYEVSEVLFAVAQICLNDYSGMWIVFEFRFL